MASHNMSPSDQAAVRSLPGNDKCADCAQNQPQWASVSFGTVFCLECSGIHRSLGVHITFVRSIAMDGWTEEQLKIMKMSGNNKCASYLASKGVIASTPLREKYSSSAAQLYKLILKARVKGEPEPTSLPPPKKKSNMSSSPGMGSSPASSGPKKVDDPNGMERLTGESEQAYVARQKKLKLDAQARMKAKFGGRGGGMGGVGSDPNYTPRFSGTPDLGSAASSVVSSAGAAFSVMGIYGRQAAKAASEAVSDPKVKEVTGNVGSTIGGFWGNISSAASQVAKNITEPEDSNLFGRPHMSEFQVKIREEKASSGSAPSKYAGFGSDTISGANPSQNLAQTANTASNSFFSKEIPGENGASSTSMGTEVKSSLSGAKSNSNDDFFANFGS